MEMYEFHKKYLKSVDFEDEYAPMFVNANGLAMSYETYRRKFKALINDHLRPWLINSTDPEFRLYGQMLYENNLGTHAMRHWFTVQLVLRGEDIANIQFWRGDKSPDSAFHYLQNKGDLVRELKPREVMMYTIDRETPAQNLQKVTVEEMTDIAQELINEGFAIQIKG